MKGSALHTKVLPSLLGGTSRHPLAQDLVRPSNPTSDSALELLSLAGQALRFERPPAPDSFLVEPQIRDERAILEEPLRRPLIRLLTAKIATDHPKRVLARSFDQLRLRPHPFDLPLIDDFVRSHAEKLGPTAQHWADKQKPEAETHSYFDPELLDETNWAQARLSRRVTFLEQRRRDYPEGARALLESTWPQEEAEARLRLLQVLQTRLSTTDQPFLTTLEKDRAPRVRGLAAKFLSRLGAGVENPALPACLERIKQGKSGMLRKRTTLELELPANVNEQSAPRWILQTFSEVSFSELAGALRLTDEELIEASMKNESLLLALALIASNDRRLNLLQIVVVHLPNTWQKLVESGLDTLGTMSESERQRWQEILVHPYGKELPPNYYFWDRLHRLTDAPAPASVMSMVLKAKFLLKLPERERGSAPWLEVIAAICPAPQRQELREQFAEFDPSQTVFPLSLLDILDQMERNRTHA